ncbi:GCN5 family acetyltransferase [Methanomicrobiaceae archaeon CYW5]|nr:GCN5 family acetyltransferase [Methanovulcanius yangii]
MNEYTFGPLGPDDANEATEIFNHYVRHTFAAYPEEPVPPAFFNQLMAHAAGYPAAAVRDADGALAGFGLLRPHRPMAVFAGTAELTCFIRPDRTGKGVGARILGILEEEGAKSGIVTILAGISSHNEGSIRFHARHGFQECGRFVGVGMKFGTLFDEVWMQKIL